MATCHFQRTVHKRTGSKARMAQKVQYLLRQGRYSPAAGRVEHLEQVPGGGKTREDFVAGDSVNLPGWAQDDPVLFFVTGEEYEQKRGVVSTEWKFSLPRELSREQQLAAAQDYMQSQLGTTHTYVWAMHEPLAIDGKPQPHVHCLWSSRTLDGIDRPGEQFFLRYRPATPEAGGAEKDPLLITFGQARRERQAYTDLMNYHLERAGSDVRLHPARLAERGFDRAPEPRVAPSHSNKARYQHEITEAWAKVQAHRAARFPHIDQEQAQARRAWERRKTELGITDVRTLDRPQFVALISAVTQDAARHPKPQPTLEELKEQAAAAQEKLRRLEAYLANVDAAQRGHLAAPALVSVLAGRELDDEASGPGLRMKLYEKEQGHGR